MNKNSEQSEKLRQNRIARERKAQQNRKRIKTGCGGCRKRAKAKS